MLTTSLRGTLLALVGAGSLAFGLMMAMPATDAPVLRAAAPAAAHASNPMACVTLGRNLVGFASSGNPWLAFNAARRVPGCGNFNADAICWSSRQWWGHAARGIVWVATWGRFTRC